MCGDSSGGNRNLTKIVCKLQSISNGQTSTETTQASSPSFRLAMINNNSIQD